MTEMDSKRSQSPSSGSTPWVRASQAGTSAHMPMESTSVPSQSKMAPVMCIALPSRWLSMGPS